MSFFFFFFDSSLAGNWSDIVEGTSTFGNEIRQYLINRSVLGKSSLFSPCQESGLPILVCNLFQQ